MSRSCLRAACNGKYRLREACTAHAIGAEDHTSTAFTSYTDEVTASATGKGVRPGIVARLGRTGEQFQRFQIIVHDDQQTPCACVCQIVTDNGLDSVCAYLIDRRNDLEPRQRSSLMRTITYIAAFAILAASVPSASSAEIVVEMLDQSKTSKDKNVYEPGLVQVNVGDTVKWISSNPSHNVAFIAGAIPKGVAVFTSPMKKEVSFTFKTPGIYAYKCAPHLGMGMVGVVVVGGDKSNLAAVRATFVPPVAKARLAPLLARIESGT